MIALVSFYVGGIASGQKFDGTARHDDDPRPRPDRPGRAWLLTCRSALRPYYPGSGITTV